MSDDLINTASVKCETVGTNAPQPELKTKLRIDKVEGVRIFV